MNTGYRSRLLAVGLVVWLLPWLVAAQENRWEKTIQGMEASDTKNPPPPGAILFAGSSSIRMWGSLAKDFSEWPVINRGFGGSTIADSTYFADRIIIPFKPKVILMYAGGNDLRGNRQPEQVADDFKAFVEKVHAALPDTRIVYLALKPTRQRWAAIEQTKTVNRLIEEYTKRDPRLSYIDGFEKFLDEKGEPRDDLLQKDGLHLNPQGYAVWCSIIKPKLMQLSPP